MHLLQVMLKQKKQQLLQIFVTTVVHPANLLMLTVMASVITISQVNPDVADFMSMLMVTVSAIMLQMDLVREEVEVKVVVVADAAEEDADKNLS